MKMNFFLSFFLSFLSFPFLFLSSFFCERRREDDYIRVECTSKARFLSTVAPRLFWHASCDAARIIDRQRPTRCRIEME